jgi:hypothetical protein
MKLPRISNPKETVTIIFSDYGDVEVPSHYRSVFEFDGKKHENIYIHKGKGDAIYGRFASDQRFLRSLDLNLDGWDGVL